MRSIFPILDVFFGISFLGGIGKVKCTGNDFLIIDNHDFIMSNSRFDIDPDRNTSLDDIWISISKLNSYLKTKPELIINEIE